jgi:hypothetical protein
VLRLTLPTLCTSASANATTPASVLGGDAPLPNCTLGGFAAEHTLMLAMSLDGLRISDASLSPPDFPHADLLAAALASADVAALVWALAERAAAYAARAQQLAALPASYNATAPVGSSLLTVTLATPLPAPAPPLIATLELAHGYPAPLGGADVALTAAALWSRGDAALRVLRLDGVPFYAAEAAAAITARLARLGDDAPLAARLAALQAAAAAAAQRCAADCSQRGVCDAVSAYPPACVCALGAAGSDCALATCPRDCSGRGACDAERTCTADAETGAVSCVGGSGRCACDAPWTGTDCSQRACGSAFLVLENLNTSTLSADALKARYSARGWAVDRVWTTPWDGLPRARGAIAGDEFYRAGPTSGVAVVRFASALDAEAARAEEEAVSPRVPSRGIASQAGLFMTQYRAAVERERYLLRFFNLLTADCSGRGTCNVTSGACACDGGADGGIGGSACELRRCAAGCAGHGACDAGTGLCDCDARYVRDATHGCVLAPLGLASTICEDAALDDRPADARPSERAAPLQLSCLLGVPLGSVTSASYCAPAAAAAVATSSASAPVVVTGPCFTQVAPGSTLCADCSGYALANVSQLHLYPDEGCTQRDPLLQYNCVRGRRPSDILPGVGALPPSRVTFDLGALRAAGVRFGAFAARPGVVRRWGGDTAAGGCGDCGAPNAYCGARFEVLLDGVPAWAGVVASASSMRLDVRDARTLTLVTDTARAPHWLPSGGPYSAADGDAPGVATQPTAANWCDGAAWADAKLL